VEDEEWRMQNSGVDIGREVTLWVAQEWHVAGVQHMARSLARWAGMSQVSACSIATSASELANNIFFHARGGGTVTVRILSGEGRVGMEVIAQDKSPGIADLQLAMQDGFSTNGGLGGGLPGVKRLMDEFQITSSARSGTRVVVRKWESIEKSELGNEKGIWKTSRTVSDFTFRDGRCTTGSPTRKRPWGEGRPGPGDRAQTTVRAQTHNHARGV